MSWFTLRKNSPRSDSRPGRRPICLGEVLIGQSSGQDELPALRLIMGAPRRKPPLTRGENIEQAKRSMRWLFRWALDAGPEAAGSAPEISRHCLHSRRATIVTYSPDAEITL